MLAEHNCECGKVIDREEIVTHVGFIECISQFKEPVRLQMLYRRHNGRSADQYSLSKPELTNEESAIYSILSSGEGKTISELAQIIGIANTVAYHTLTSLQNKKLVKAIPAKPIMFIAIK